MNPFHQHLDACPHCRTHPFDLCPDGAKLLEETAKKELNTWADAFLKSGEKR